MFAFRSRLVTCVVLTGALLALLEPSAAAQKKDDKKPIPKVEKKT